ncbi:MAG: SLBB domain-containing protein [Halobacteriovoraceae bacterium]|nr:SLBB domain-containing protein [Halobacteriovoraceae bacterium]
MNLKRVLFFILFFQFNAIGAEDIDIQNLVLPTEIKELNKKPGAIYYSPGKKKSALVPTNIWGEIKNPGLHYIPQNTNLIKGLSLAGGTTGDANLDEIYVSRRVEGKWTKHRFDLTEGGELEAFKFDLEAGDVVFVKKERFYENRTYYTSLISVIATVLSTILIYEQVND